MNRKRVILLITGAYWIMIFIATHVPVPSTGTAGVNDKLMHFAAYFMLAGLLYWSILVYRPATRRIGWIVLGVAMVYGAADELLQIPVGRSCELADWIANLAGAATMVLSIFAVRRLRSPGPASAEAKAKFDATESASCSVAD